MTINRRPRLRTLEHILWDVKEAMFVKIRGRSPRCCGLFLMGAGEGKGQIRARVNWYHALLRSPYHDWQTLVNSFSIAFKQRRTYTLRCPHTLTLTWAATVDCADAVDGVGSVTILLTSGRSLWNNYKQEKLHWEHVANQLSWTL